MDPVDPPVAPEIPSEQPQAQPADGTESTRQSEPVSIEKDPPETRAVRWIFLGSEGLRAGWSVLVFILIFAIFASCVGFAFVHFNLISTKRGDFTARGAFFGEMISFLAMAGAAAIVALIERRRGNLLAYNLTDTRGGFHFVTGYASGFAALSALIGVLAWGGWLHFGNVALSGIEIFKFGALWAVAFLLVGFVEEGIFRCFLLSTLTRGINFWWALGLVALICGELLWLGKGNGIWGVYLVAALGLIPCALLHLNKAKGSGFWQAAWVTSTLFGFIHTTNNGENWIGIFAAAFIGFAFCVSVWATGSAWWAIGCHAAWDWGETYFYGAADSGNVATGHYLTTTPSGSALWSGGTDGPEGSVLVIVIILLLIAAVLVFYRRGKSDASAARTSEVAAG
ncbi:MAG: CPBP family intramembrane glutamic endopeptidase [Terracidiphilus sp.]